MEGFMENHNKKALIYRHRLSRLGFCAKPSQMKDGKTEEKGGFVKKTYQTVGVG